MVNSQSFWYESVKLFQLHSVLVVCEYNCNGSYSKELQVGLPWELLYAEYLILMAESEVKRWDRS